jgi:hypothetical protein
MRPEITWTRIERSPFSPQAGATPVLRKPHVLARQRRVEGVENVRIARAAEDGTEVTPEPEHVARILDAGDTKLPPRTARYTRARPTQRPGKYS